MDAQKVTVRLSSETVDVLRALVDSGEFRSLSEAVTTVLDRYAEERLAQGVVPVPDLGEDVLRIEDLTIDGSSLDDAVCAAAREFVRWRGSCERRRGDGGMRRGGQACDGHVP